MGNVGKLGMKAETVQKIRPTSRRTIKTRKIKIKIRTVTQLIKVTMRPNLRRKRRKIKIRTRKRPLISQTKLVAIVIRKLMTLGLVLGQSIAANVSEKVTQQKIAGIKKAIFMINGVTNA